MFLRKNIFLKDFNMNPKIMFMKSPKHLLNTTEITTSRNGVEILSVKRLSGIMSNNGQIFNQNPLLFL